MQSVTEIERRFLLKRNPHETPSEIINIEQWYEPIRLGASVLRYRKSINMTRHELVFEEIEKLKRDAMVSEEFIREISRDEFMGLVNPNKLKYIRKKRQIYNFNGLKFEVDKFQDLSLVICEVELPSTKTSISFPPFIEDLIICEITDMTSFSNFSLAENFNKVISYR